MLTGRLGGYELKRKLGQGGMGAVYLARQISLDRDVAVKVLNPDLGQDAQFVSRFVREAYAAAQLVHHNVVQIHDIGEDDDTHFYSMEYVKGQSLADLIRAGGPIDPDTAAGYILQAARGLKLAHDQGMIHRDIKPDNLLLSRDGIVKVADLGLVKRYGVEDGADKGTIPHSAPAAPNGPSATLARSSMGTPAYMAPEQAADASRVDGRADIYSLGCTLFALLVGHPPFEAESPGRVLELARTKSVPAPKSLNDRVASELSRITRVMTARNPDERYANMAMVIRDLEQYLGVETGGNFSPRQQHVEELEACVKRFNASGMSRFRNVVIKSLALMGVFLAGMLLWNSRYAAGFTVAAVLAGTAIMYHVIISLAGKSYLMARLRQLALGAAWRDWIRWAATAALVILAIFALQLVGEALLLLVSSTVIAALMYFVLDSLVTRDRQHSLARAQDMLRGLRLKGLDEDSVRRFACEYSGRQWEEFYEALFGYEAKMEARKRWGRSARGYDRPKFGRWRDPVVQLINHREEARAEARQRKHLLRVQTKALQAEGVEEVAAAKQARRMAELIYAQAQELHARAAQVREAAATLPPETQPAVQKPREAFRFDTEEKIHITGNYVTRRYGGPTQLLFGQRARFIVAAILLLGFFAWRYQNRAAIIDEVQQFRGYRVDPTMQDPTRVIDTRKVVEVTSHTTQNLDLAFVPAFICNVLGTWNAGVAGLILLVGSHLRSIRIGIPLLAAAGIIVFGHYLPAASSLSDNPRKIALAIGSLMALIAFVFMRRE